MRVLSLVLLLLCIVKAGTEHDESLQRLVDISPPFLGADVATSIAGALSDANATLWLFGDTLLGTMVSGHRDISSMPRNSVGVVRGASVAPMQHVWRAEGDADVGGFFAARCPGHFVWVTAGAVLGGRTLLLASEVKNTATGLKFAVTSSTLFELTDTRSASPLQWTYSASHVRHTDPSLVFASAATSAHGDGTHMYVLGTHNGTRGVMARLSAKGEWSYLRTYKPQVQWSSHFEHASQLQTVMPGVCPPETTMTYHAGRWVMLDIAFGSLEVRVRTAQQPWGPWSASQFLAKISVPDNNNSSRFFCYAPKVHVEHCNATSLAWTYVCNAFSLKNLINFPSVYVPVFMRTTLPL